MSLINLQEELQSVKNEMETNRQTGLDTSSFEMRIANLVQQIADAEQKQVHEGRVQDATTEITTYFDTLYVGGQTMRELCSDEEAYQILRLSVSQAFIDQATKNSEVLSQVQTDSQAAIKQANDRANELDVQNTELLQENHKIKMELTDITNKFTAAAEQLAEVPSSEEADKLKQEIKNLNAQLELKAKADEPKGDAKSQIDAFSQERDNKKVKVTNLRLADPYGINTKDYLATDVLSGLELQIHSNYIHSYKEVTAEEAEQYRADEANKKAELELQAQVIPVMTPDITPVNPVSEEEATTKEDTFQSNQVQTADSGANTESTGDSLVEQMVDKESEVITLESLQAQVNAIKAHVGLAA